MTIDCWPGLRRATMKSPITARLNRPSSMLADGEDTVCLMIDTGGTMALRQRGRVTVTEPGESFLLVYREPAIIDFKDATYLAARVPAAALAPMISDVGSFAAHCMSRSIAAISLLRGYLEPMPARMTDPRLGQLSAANPYDLMSLAVCAKPDRSGPEEPRTLGAFRLDAMKAGILRDTSLSLADLAARHGVTPR